MTHNNRVLQLVCILAVKSSALALGLNGFALRIPISAFRFKIGPRLLSAGMGISVGILGTA